MQWALLMLVLVIKIGYWREAGTAGPHAELLRPVAPNQSHSQPIPTNPNPNHIQCAADYVLLMQTELKYTVHQVHLWLEFWRDFKAEDGLNNQIGARF